MTIAEAGVAPDGLTVDDDGAIWVALWGGGAVHRYAPDGALLAVVELPVERPTSCAFGGRDRATMFVTTSREGLDEVAMERQPHAGHVFRIDGLGVTGPPSCRRSAVAPHPSEPGRLRTCPASGRSGGNLLTASGVGRA